MKLRLKYVGIGLFLAGLLFTLNSQYDFIASGSSIETSNEQALEKKELEIEKLRKQLKEVNGENNHSKTDENESKEDSASNPNNNSSKTNNKDSVNNSDGEKENDVVTATVIIYENMSLYEIGQQVEDLNLIENGRQLELYLSKPEYARSVQKGSFELSSNMTLEEMASILTAKMAQ